MIPLAPQVLSRKAIHMSNGTHTELRRRNPQMKFITVAAGLAPVRTNYLGYEMTRGASMDAQACLCAIALSRPPDRRPAMLKQALKDLFEDQLEIDIPEQDKLALEKSAASV